MPMDDDRGRGRTQSSPSGMGAGRAAERTTTSSSGRNTGSPGASGGDRDRPSPGGSDNRGGGEAAREAADKASRKAAEKAADDARAKATQDAVDRERQKAADDARAKATQDAVDRDRIQAAIAEGRRQSELQRVAAGIASLRGVPLPPQVQEAAVLNRISATDLQLDQNPAINPTVSMIRPDLQEVAAREYQARLVAAAAQAKETRLQISEANRISGTPSLSGFGTVINPTSVSPMSGQGTIGSRPVKDPTLPTSALDRFYSGEMGYKAPAVGIDNVSPRGRELMIRAAIGEAANQGRKNLPLGPSGIEAVIYTMVNRLQSGKHGETIEDVVTAPKQYSAFNEGNPAGSYAYSVSEDSPIYKEVAAAVDAVLSGSVRDPTFGAVNYANVAEVNRTYTQDEINRGLAPSQASIDRVNAASADPSAIRIGAHTFTNNSAISGPGVSGTQPPAAAVVRSFLDKGFDNVKAVAKTVVDATGDFLTNKSLRDEIVRNNNRDRQMTSEEVNIAMFNRLHPEAGSNKELYGGRDRTPLPTQVASSTTPSAVVPPVVPTEPVMPTVPNFAAAQQYIGTPTVATPGFNFSMPFAPRPQVDFANLGQAYAPTALASAPPLQPLPGIPGAMYSTPYQRLG